MSISNPAAVTYRETSRQPVDVVRTVTWKEPAALVGIEPPVTTRD